MYGFLIAALLCLLAAGTAVYAEDPSLQEVLDSLGFSIDVNADEIFAPLFQADLGSGAATGLAQYTDYKGVTEFGWYSPDDPDTQHVVFPADPNGHVGKSNSFYVDGDAFVGFYISLTHLDTWYTEDALNSDAGHHCRAFPTIIDDQIIDWSYVLAWEDQPGLSGADYQDLVVRIDGFSVVPEPGLVSLLGLGLPGAAVLLRSRRRKAS
jgi:hypothetical protein